MFYAFFGIFISKNVGTHSLLTYITKKSQTPQGCLTTPLIYTIFTFIIKMIFYDLFNTLSFNFAILN